MALSPACAAHAVVLVPPSPLFNLSALLRFSGALLILLPSGVAAAAGSNRSAVTWQRRWRDDRHNRWYIHPLIGRHIRPFGHAETPRQVRG